MQNVNENIKKKIKEKLGKPIVGRSEEETDVLHRLKYFYKGYELRDETIVEEYVKELMDENIQIIGTDGVYPGDREWKSGHKAAIELFRSDWKYWGDVTMFPDHAEIDVVKDSACVTMFGTVRRDTKNNDRMNFEASKARSLQRIKDIVEEMEKQSTLALFQIIQDASSVLYQYKQGDVFVWPLRMSIGFILKEEKWMIKQIHFSWPGRGFPSVRLLD